MKWEGFDSRTNTWEKKSGLPKEDFDEYARQCGKDKRSSSDDDEPIAKKLKRGAFTQ